MNAPLRDPTLPVPGWFPSTVNQEWARHRSSARACWRSARQLRRYVQEHSWHLDQDDIDATLAHAQSLRKDAAEHLRRGKEALR
jgi:hypothetical protein